MNADEPTWRNPGCGTHMAVIVGLPAVVTALVTAGQLAWRVHRGR